MITLRLNGAERELDVAPDTPLLWVLREQAELTGTKFGCGAALCGACTVHVDGEATRSCVTPVSSVAGRAVTTIEGVQGAEAVAVLEAWTARGVAQCGYCQPGMVMTAVALLATTRTPDDAAIDRAFAGHVCRCGSYQRLRAAVHDAASVLRDAAARPSDAADTVREASVPDGG